MDNRSAENSNNSFGGGIGDFGLSRTIPKRIYTYLEEEEQQDRQHQQQQQQRLYFN